MLHNQAYRKIQFLFHNKVTKVNQTKIVKLQYKAWQERSQLQFLKIWTNRKKREKIISKKI